MYIGLLVYVSVSISIYLHIALAEHAAAQPVRRRNGSKNIKKSVSTIYLGLTRIDIDIDTAMYLCM